MELLGELAFADSDHADVAVIHESEWSLTAYKSGYLVLEHLEDGHAMHLGPVEDEAVRVQLMTGLAEGNIEQVRAALWHPGYPPRR